MGRETTQEMEINLEEHQAAMLINLIRKLATKPFLENKSSRYQSQIQHNVAQNICYGIYVMGRHMDSINPRLPLFTAQIMG